MNSDDVVTDETVAAWSKEQNRGVPSWAELDEVARQWWRKQYVIRHPGARIVQGRGNPLRSVGES
jgi:hypothetical protein